MTMHLVAYGKSITTKGTSQAITPVPDNTVTISGNHIYVPDKYNQLVYAGALTKGAQAFTTAQLQSPSLRDMFYPDISPLHLGTNFTGAQQVTDYSQTPIPLVTNEGLDFYSDGGGDGSTAQYAYGLAWLADGAVQPAKGEMVTVRCTAAITLSSATWVNGVLTISQTLPVGNYDVVGMRAEGSGLVAARLAFIGQSAVTRPGVTGVASPQIIQGNQFRYGNAGVFGTFNSITPPSLDALGDTGTAQVVYLDLIPR